MTAHAPDEPYSMWRRDAVCLPWETEPAILLRVVTPSKYMPIRNLTTVTPITATTP